MKRKRILMCGSRLSVKGGMVSVIQNYLSYEGWGEYQIEYVPTHVEKHKLLVALYFLFSYVQIFFLALFRQIKVAHLHVSERGSFYRKALLLRLLQSFDVKVILHHHGAEFELFYQSLSDEKKQYVNKILTAADLNIVLSKRLVSMITEKAPEARVEALYNAVPTYARNEYDVQANGVLFFGRLGERKGVYDMLTAIKQLDGELPQEVTFYLCGDGEVEAVKERIKQYGIAHRIAHVGWIGKEKKAGIFSRTALNALPSYNEGLPMSILETMAYGIPNLSTNIASIPEVITPENGVLIEPGDVEALKAGLVRLLTDEALRKTMSENSYRFICEGFSLEAHLERVKELYRGLEAKE